MDLIAGLPYRNSEHALMVCCDNFGKLTHLISTWVREDQLSAPEVAILFFENWAHYYGIPKWLVHDCDVHFTALFWRALWAMIGMQTLFSSAYHL